MPVHRSHGLRLLAVLILRHDRRTSASDCRFLRSYLSSSPQSGTVFIGYLFICFCFFFPSLCLPFISFVNQWHCNFLFLNAAIIRGVTEVISAVLGKGKGKISLYGHGQALMAAGGWGFQTYWTIDGTLRWKGCQPHPPAAFTPGDIPDTHFC